MQNGGCHPTDGCRRPARTPASPARTSGSSPPTSSDEATGKTLFPPYAIRKFDGVKVGFIGMTLEGTPTSSSPAGIAGLEVPRRGGDGQPLRAELRERARRATRSSCCCTRAARQTRRSPHRRVQRPLRPDRRHRQPHDRRGRPVHHRPHAPAVQLRDRRAPGDQRELVRARWSPTSTSRSTARTRDVDAGRGQQRDRHASDDGTPCAADIAALVAHYQTLAAPLADRVDRRARPAPAHAAPDDSRRERTLGNLIADAQLAATDGRHGGAVAAFMNPGGVRADIGVPGTASVDLRRGVRGPAVRQHRW